MVRLLLIELCFAQLEENSNFSEEQKAKILSVTLPWDLPGVTAENRWWLTEKILLHSVSFSFYSRAQ